MSQIRYKIVFDGSLMPGNSLDEVKANLASLFKSDSARIDALFGRGPVAIKRDLDEAQAEQYLNVLQRAGARARKEPDLTAALSLVETEEEKANKAEQAQPPQSSMTCPKCGHTQQSAAECSACGVIIEKYLARQAAVAETSAQRPTPVAAAQSQTPYSPPRADIDPYAGQVGELKINSFKGRIGRLRYLAWSLGLLFIFVGAMLGISAITAVAETLGNILLAGAVIGMLIISAQIGVQRLHDMGWSGWLWLLNVVPLISSVFWIIMMVVPGPAGSNRYGPPPPPNSLGVNLVAGIFLILFIGGLLMIFLSGFAMLAVFGGLFGELLKGS